MVCAEFFGEGFLILPTCNRHGIETHFGCVLDAEMTEAANPEHGNNIAARCAAVSQRVESGYTSAHQRRAINGREFIRHKRQRFSWRNHVFAVTAVE